MNLLAAASAVCVHGTKRVTSHRGPAHAGEKLSGVFPEPGSVAHLLPKPGRHAERESEQQLAPGAAPGRPPRLQSRCLDLTP